MLNTCRRELLGWNQWPGAVPTLPSSGTTPGNSEPCILQSSQVVVKGRFAYQQGQLCLDFLEMQILRPHPEPMESESLGVRLTICLLYKPSQ